jgi:hypothetical protein
MERSRIVSNRKILSYVSVWCLYAARVPSSTFGTLRKELIGLTELICRRGDSNPHELPHTPLKRARLPVPPLRHLGEWQFQELRSL